MTEFEAKIKIAKYKGSSLSTEMASRIRHTPITWKFLPTRQQYKQTGLLLGTEEAYTGFVTAKKKTSNVWARPYRFDVIILARFTVNQHMISQTIRKWLSWLGWPWRGLASALVYSRSNLNQPSHRMDFRGQVGRHLLFCCLIRFCHQFLPFLPSKSADRQTNAFTTVAGLQDCTLSFVLSGLPKKTKNDLKVHMTIRFQISWFVHAWTKGHESLSRKIPAYLGCCTRNALQMINFMPPNNWRCIYSLQSFVKSFDDDFCCWSFPKLQAKRGDKDLPICLQSFAPLQL